MRLSTRLPAILIVLVFAACSARPTGAQRFPYRLDADGTIPVWFLRSPQPVSARPVPAPDPVPTAGSWRPTVATDEGVVRPLLGPPNRTQHHDAFVEIHSAQEQEAVLAIGHVGTLQVWWNGQPLPGPARSTALVRDQFIAPIRISKGLNRCLVRVEGAGEALFAARIVDRSGRPLPGLGAALPLAKSAEPFGVAPGERPDPLVRLFRRLPSATRPAAQSSGAVWLANELARAEIRFDRAPENGLTFDFYDGSAPGGGATFIPALSQLSVETEKGLYYPSGRRRDPEGDLRLTSAIPGAFLTARYRPDPPEGGERSKLACRVSFFLPVARNAAVIRVRLTNPTDAPIDKITLHYSFMTRDDRFEAVEATQQMTVLKGTGGLRWIAMAATPSFPEEPNRRFAFPTGVLDAAQARSQKAQPRVLYPGRPATNVAVRLSSGVGRLGPKAHLSTFFFIAGGRTRHQAVRALRDCVRVGGSRLEAQLTKSWKRLTAGSIGITVPQESRMPQLFVASRNSLTARLGPLGRLAVGDEAPIREATIAAEGLVLSGQRKQARALLAYQLRHAVLRQGHPEDRGRLLHAVWLYTSFTGDRALVQTYRPRLVSMADMLARPRPDRPAAPSLFASSDEGYWGRTGLALGYGLAQNEWAAIGLEKAVALFARHGETEPDPVGNWRRVAAAFRHRLYGARRYSFVRDGRLVTRLNPDGSTQAGIPSGALEPDLSVTVPFLVGGQDPQSAMARKTAIGLSALWNGGGRWSFGGAGRYNAASDQTDQAAGPSAAASLQYARLLLLQNRARSAGRLIDWTADRGESGRCWPERLSIFARADRSEDRDQPADPEAWGQWLLLILQEAAGLRPTADGLSLVPHLPKRWAGLTLTNVRFRSATYTIRYEGYGSEVTAVRFNGKEIKGAGAVLPIKSGVVVVQLGNSIEATQEP